MAAAPSVVLVGLCDAREAAAGDAQQAAAGDAQQAAAGDAREAAAGDAQHVAAGDAQQAGAGELARLLGPARALAVARTLLTRATAWAETVAPGRVRVAAPAAVEQAARAALGAGGPLLVVWPELPRWPSEHAAGVLGDLDAGCEVSIGPVFSGGLYLLALTRDDPELLALVHRSRIGPDALGPALDAVQRAGVGVGLLRAERGLRTAADIRAALADPLLDRELRAVLS